MARKTKMTKTAAKPAAVILLRVSTDGQARDGISLDAKESKCRAHCERLGLPVAAVFRDAGVSGRDTVENRPGLRATIEFATVTPGAVVVVYSISRLARRQRMLWNLLDDREGYGLSVSSATESFDTSTPTGRAMLGMIATFAALEADAISERTRDALAEVKAQGRKLGAKSMVELGAVESVRLAKALYESGAFTHRSLADELNRRGVATAKGGKWWPKTVRSALNQELPR
ncbi:MAG: recombinase family protein [Myxococcales bacterium]|nr:recombinase family protein [Myxococcales bacterium]